MSLLSINHWRIGIGVSYLAMACTRGNEITAWLYTEEGLEHPHFLATLTKWIETLKIQNRSFDIYLSDALSPSFMVPWDYGFFDESYRENVANEKLLAFYHNIRDAYQVKTTLTGFGNPMIASIIQKNVLAKLEQDLSFIKINSVQSLIPSILRNIWSRLEKKNTFAIFTPDGVHIFNIENQKIKLMRSLPTHEFDNYPLPSIVKRELMLDGIAFNEDDLQIVNQPGSKLTLGWLTDLNNQNKSFLIGGRK